MQLWRQFAGQDVYLWVRPRGKINRSETPPGRVRAVTDKVAAHELVYAEAGSVRLATDEEIAAFRAESDERRTRLQRETAEQTTRLAQAQLEAILGQFLPRGLSVQEVQPGAAAAPIDLANLSLEEIEALLLKVREAKGGGAPPAEDAPWPMHRSQRARRRPKDRLPDRSPCSRTSAPRRSCGASRRRASARWSRSRARVPRNSRSG
jgi:hypothetical protein